MVNLALFIGWVILVVGIVIWLYKAVRAGLRIFDFDKSLGIGAIVGAIVSSGMIILIAVIITKNVLNWQTSNIVDFLERQIDNLATGDYSSPFIDEQNNPYPNPDSQFVLVPLPVIFWFSRVRSWLRFQAVRFTLCRFRVALVPS